MKEKSCSKKLMIEKALKMEIEKDVQVGVEHMMVLFCWTLDIGQRKKKKE